MNKLAVLIAMLLVTGCAPRLAPLIPTADARRTAFSQQKTDVALGTTLPTLTPRPAATQDKRSDFEICVASGVGVRYVISGEGVNAVSITQENDTGGTDQGDFQVPYCQPFRNLSAGDFLYISAQIISPRSGAGSITCKIYVGNSVVAQATASGFASIATCRD